MSTGALPPTPWCESAAVRGHQTGVRGRNGRDTAARTRRAGGRGGEREGAGRAHAARFGAATHSAHGGGGWVGRLASRRRGRCCRRDIGGGNMGGDQGGDAGRHPPVCGRYKNFSTDPVDRSSTELILVLRNGPITPKQLLRRSRGVDQRVPSAVYSAVGIASPVLRRAGVLALAPVRHRDTAPVGLPSAPPSPPRPPFPATARCCTGRHTDPGCVWGSCGTMGGVPIALALLLVLLTAALFWRHRATAGSGGGGGADTGASSRSSAAETAGGGGGSVGDAGGAPLRKVTAAELARHTTEHDVWLAIDGRVYDFSSYIDLHPGGLALLNNAGGDATAGFHGDQHPQRVNDLVRGVGEGGGRGGGGWGEGRGGWGRHLKRLGSAGVARWLWCARAARGGRLVHSLSVATNVVVPVWRGGALGVVIGWVALPVRFRGLRVGMTLPVHGGGGGGVADSRLPGWGAGAVAGRGARVNRGGHPLPPPSLLMAGGPSPRPCGASPAVTARRHILWPVAVGAQRGRGGRCRGGAGGCVGWPPRRGGVGRRGCAATSAHGRRRGQRRTPRRGGGWGCRYTGRAGGGGVVPAALRPRTPAAVQGRWGHSAKKTTEKEGGWQMKQQLQQKKGKGAIPLARARSRPTLNDRLDEKSSGGGATRRGKGTGPVRGRATDATDGVPPAPPVLTLRPPSPEAPGGGSARSWRPWARRPWRKSRAPAAARRR